MSGASCPECGKPVPPQGAKLCPSCGYPLMLDRPAVVEPTPHKIVHKPVEPERGPSYTSQVPYPGTMAGRPPMRQQPYPGPPQPGGPGPYGAPQPRTPVPYQPPQRVQAFGPHCPACRHVNPPNRKRCEVCAAELWPGAAAPTRWMPDPPPVPITHPRSTWWKTALLIGAPVAVMVGVWALAYFL